MASAVLQKVFTHDNVQQSTEETNEGSDADDLEKAGRLICVGSAWTLSFSFLKTVNCNPNQLSWIWVMLNSFTNLLSAGTARVRSRT